MTPPVEDEKLAAYQARLIEALIEGSLGDSPSDDPRLAPFAEWVRAFDPRAIAAAQAAVRKWAKPDGAQPGDRPSPR